VSGDAGAPADPVERAVVLGDRLPASGQRSEVHLVSVEGRYGKDGRFDFGPAKGDDRVRLVSLASWSFFCTDATQSFMGLVHALGIGALHLPVDDETFSAGADADAVAHARARLLAGAVALPHRFRDGSRSISWYHGPLVAREPDAAAVDPPARAADGLLLFDETTGLFDASYAAAWELGRLMMLERTAVATSLYAWKRRHARSLSAMRHVADLGFDLPSLRPGDGSKARAFRAAGLPAPVVDFFDELSILRDVPFSYLVPDPGMLPRESMRCFEVDRAWIACLRDGAFSVGRVTAADAGRDAAHHRAHLEKIPAMSGVLLRSSLVSGYPGLHLDAYEARAGEGDERLSQLDPARFPKLACVRFERLSKNVLFCLFAGKVEMLDLHPRPEMLHFGLDADLTKELRGEHGEQGRKQLGALDDAISAGRVVDFGELARRIQAKLGLEKISTAVFAYQMLAGVELGRFIRPEQG
jgi:hypothetical protein